MCTFMSRPPHRLVTRDRGCSHRPGSRLEVVVVPLLADAADAIVERLRGLVVAGGLPLEKRRAALAHGVEAGADQGLPHALPAALGCGEQVVHDPDPLGAAGGPHPEDRREAERLTLVVARDELDALELRVRDQCPRHREQRVVRWVDLVEVGITAHQRQKMAEIVLAYERNMNHSGAPLGNIVWPVCWKPNDA